ncbi:hypothetical protein PsorP6_008643 [Peronosclerospora sorghi]|uniref:Uncharacterized protein n=1 Tax=Peronosclerospora sorghi TaxID=230839 RepID=A0ACC0W9J7_9STRA|nr:hypothetical protein PsorP6_008643 [Peronosclerospora sorghi]
MDGEMGKDPMLASASPLVHPELLMQNSRVWIAIVVNFYSRQPRTEDTTTFLDDDVGFVFVMIEYLNDSLHRRWHEMEKWMAARDEEHDKSRDQEEEPTQQHRGSSLHIDTGDPRLGCLLCTVHEHVANHHVTKCSDASTEIRCFWTKTMIVNRFAALYSIYKMLDRMKTLSLCPVYAVDLVTMWVHGTSMSKESPMAPKVLKLGARTNGPPSTNTFASTILDKQLGKYVDRSLYIAAFIKVVHLLSELVSLTNEKWPS